MLLADERFDAALIDGDDDDDIIAKVPRRIRREVAFVRIGAANEAESGWDGAIGKPFLVKDLVAAVESAVERRRVTA